MSNLPAEVLEMLAKLPETKEASIALPDLDHPDGGKLRVNRTVKVSVIELPDGSHNAVVDGDQFEGGKRYKTAVNSIKKRLEYLWTNVGYLVVTNQMREDAVAGRILTELRRRQKIEKSWK